MCIFNFSVMRSIAKIIIGGIILICADIAGHLFLKENCEKGFGIKSYSDVLMVGHSHLNMSVDKSVLSDSIGLSVAKYYRSGVDIHARRLMANQYLESKYADSLKTVIFCVDASTFTAEGLSANSYTLFYPWMDDDLYKDMVASEASFGDYWFHKVFKLSRYNQDLYGTAIKGLLNSEDRNNKTKGLDIEGDPDSLKGSTIKLNKSLMEELRKAVNDVADKNIKVILLQTPIAKYLINGNEQEYLKVKEFYQELAKSSQVYYIDFTDELADKYDLFFNSTHLNVRGQELYTQRLIRELKPILFDNEGNKLH